MRMLKDNRGVSLTELIIAMSIIVILSVTSLMSVAVLTGAKVNRVCEDTVALMERCKTLSLGKEQGQVEARVLWTHLPIPLLRSCIRERACFLQRIWAIPL